MKELKEKLILKEEDFEVPDEEWDENGEYHRPPEENNLTIEGESKEVPESTTDTIVSEEDVDNGMYTVISQEMRDTLQDIENIKSIITTLKANDVTREDVVATLETMIDERTIHVGMLQTILDSFSEGTKELIDQGVEQVEEQPKEGEEIVDTTIDKTL